MSTHKRKLNAALLISAALASAMLFLACPPEGDDPDPVEPPPPTGGPYDIMLWQPTTDGDVEISPRRAESGATITITLKPNTGFEPDNLRVFDASNFQIPYTSTGTAYTYTFTMKPSLVRVSVDFVLLSEAIDNANKRISVSSSWDEIDALNALLKKAGPPPASPATSPVLIGYNILAGVKDLSWTDPSPPVASNSSPVPLPTTTNPLNKQWTQLGIVRSKMRNSEDLTKWIPLTWPSPDTITFGADVKNHYDSDEVGTDRTILYYVKENNSTPLPPLVRGTGWQAGNPFTINDQTNFPYFLQLDGIQEIPLIYEVGTDPARSIKYSMWLYPVAQYTAIYDPGTSGDVVIQEYLYDSSLPAIVSGGSLGLTANTFDNFNKVEKLTLNSRNTQATGSVGSLTTTTPPLSPHDGSRNIFVEIRPSQPNVLVSVYMSSGNLVRDIITGTLRTDISSVSSGSGAAAVGGGPGYFYPESRQYTIRVRSTTPPAPFN